MAIELARPMELVEDDKGEKILALAGEVCKEKATLTLGTDSLAAVHVVSVAGLAMCLIQIWKERPQGEILVFGAVIILMIVWFAARSQQTNSLLEKKRHEKKENMLNTLKQMREQEIWHRERELKHQRNAGTRNQGWRERW